MNTTTYLVARKDWTHAAGLSPLCAPLSRQQWSSQHPVGLVKGQKHTFWSQTPESLFAWALPDALGFESSAAGIAGGFRCRQGRDHTQASVEKNHTHRKTGSALSTQEKPIIYVSEGGFSPFFKFCSSEDFIARIVPAPAPFTGLCVRIDRMPHTEENIQSQYRFCRSFSLFPAYLHSGLMGADMKRTRKKCRSAL